MDAMRGKNVLINMENMREKGAFWSTWTTSVADPDPGSGAFLTPGSGIRNRFIPDLGSWISDPGSRIPNSYFWELSDNFLGKMFYNSLKFGQIFFFSSSKKKKIILHFVKFVATNKCMTTIFCSPLYFVAVFRSGIRDLGSGIRDPGWVKIRIRDRG